MTAQVGVAAEKQESLQDIVEAVNSLSETGRCQWRDLIEFCSENPFVSLRVNVANGAPVSAEEVVPQLRFGKGHPRGTQSSNGRR